MKNLHLSFKMKAAQLVTGEIMVAFIESFKLNYNKLLSNPRRIQFIITLKYRPHLIRL